MITLRASLPFSSSVPNIIKDPFTVLPGARQVIWSQQAATTKRSNWWDSMLIHAIWKVNIDFLILFHLKKKYFSCFTITWTNRQFCKTGQEIELSMHDGTVRDVCFIEDMSNKSSLLVSGGAGDCKIYVTDCVTGTPFQALTGHSGLCGNF